MNLKKLKPYFLYVYVIMFVFTVMLILYIFFNFKYNPEYNSANIPDRDESDNTTGISYNYYLDGSPSMLGYFAVENNTMSILADAIAKVNEGNGDKEFNFYNDEFNSVPENVFYNYMSSPEDAQTRWDDLVGEQELIEIINEIDLSHVFRDSIMTKSEESNDNVNVIITDMNFATEDGDEENYQKKMDSFADYLAEENKKASICVYNFSCSFLGDINSDSYYSGWKDIGKVDYKHSFFVIISSRNNSAYDSYISSFESSLAEIKNIDLTKKFELKNSAFGDNHSFTPIPKESIDLEKLNGFNFDNKTKKLPENALGLRFYDNNTNKSSVQIQLAEYPLEQTSIITEKQEKNSATIETFAKVYYPSNNQYLEYTDEKIVEKDNAVLEENDGVSALIYDLEVRQDAEIPNSWFDDKHFIIDVNFYMANPGYAVPGWVDDLNSDTWSKKQHKKFHIKHFFESLTEEKNNGYKDNVSEYQRYMGNLLVYVHY